MAESIVRRYRDTKRGREVEAMHYLGGFPLDFLLPNEKVRTSLANERAVEVVVEQVREVITVPTGFHLVRHPGGALSVFDSISFVDRFEDVD